MDGPYLHKQGMGGDELNVECPKIHKLYREEEFALCIIFHRGTITLFGL